jgi:hypothetical protein
MEGLQCSTLQGCSARLLLHDLMAAGLMAAAHQL